MSAASDEAAATHKANTATTQQAGVPPVQQVDKQHKANIQWKLSLQLVNKHQD